jgi:hypothetical protein
MAGQANGQQSNSEWYLEVFHAVEVMIGAGALGSAPPPVIAADFGTPQEARDAGQGDHASRPTSRRRGAIQQGAKAASRTATSTVLHGPDGIFRLSTLNGKAS